MPEDYRGVTTVDSRMPPTYLDAPAAHLEAPAAYLEAPAAHLEAPAAHLEAPAAYLEAPAAYLDRKFIPSSSPRMVSGNMRPSTSSWVMPTEVEYSHVSWGVGLIHTILS